jgi:hypothetical protein
MRFTTGSFVSTLRRFFYWEQYMSNDIDEFSEFSRPLARMSSLVPACVNLSIPIDDAHQLTVFVDTSHNGSLKPAEGFRLLWREYHSENALRNVSSCSNSNALEFSVYLRPRWHSKAAQKFQSLFVFVNFHGWKSLSLGRMWSQRWAPLPKATTKA